MDTDISWTLTPMDSDPSRTLTLHGSWSPWTLTPMDLKPHRLWSLMVTDRQTDRQQHGPTDHAATPALDKHLLHRPQSPAQLRLTRCRALSLGPQSRCAPAPCPSAPQRQPFSCPGLHLPCLAAACPSRVSPCCSARPSRGSPAGPSLGPLPRLLPADVPPRRTAAGCSSTADSSGTDGGSRDGRPEPGRLPATLARAAAAGGGAQPVPPPQLLGTGAASRVRRSPGVQRVRGAACAAEPGGASGCGGARGCKRVRGAACAAEPGGASGCGGARGCSGAQAAVRTELWLEAGQWCHHGRAREQLPPAAQVHPSQALLLPGLRGGHPPAAPRHDQAPVLPLDAERCHAGREPGGLPGVADRRRGSHQLRPGLPVARPLHSLLLCLLVSAHLQGLQDGQLLQLHGLLLHLHGSDGHQHHPGCGHPGLGCLRLDRHHLLLRHQCGLCRGDAHPYHHVHCCGCVLLHRPQHGP